jgi:hypothetical protein
MVDIGVIAGITLVILLVLTVLFTMKKVKESDGPTDIIR